MRIKGTNSIGFRDIAKAGNLVINGDTTITDSGIYAKGSITINGNGITIIDNPAVANTVPTAVDTTLATPLKKIFDLNKIETGFDIATTLGQNLNEFRTKKARDIDAIGQTVARDAKGNIIKDPVTGKPMTVAQVAQLPSTDARYISALGAVDADKVNPLSKYNDLQSAWGNGGWGTIVLTSLAGAANGNVTGGTAQLVQNSAINTIQQFAIQGNKALAANINNSLLSAGVKNLLHTIVNCGAAEMKGGSCATAAGATAATVALNALFNVPVKTMSESEKLAYSNLIQTILAGVATGANVNAAEAVFSGKAEVENNGVASGRWWYPDPIFFIRQAKEYQPCYSCQEFGAARLTAQGWSKTPQGKAFGTAWSDTKKKLEIAAIFVPGFRTVTLGMTVGEAVYYVVIEEDMSKAVQATLVQVVGRKFEQLNPYKPSMGITEAQYKSAVEAMKWTFDQGLTGIKNGVNP